MGFVLMHRDFWQLLKMRLELPTRPPGTPLPPMGSCSKSFVLKDLLGRAVCSKFVSEAVLSLHDLRSIVPVDH